MDEHGMKEAELRQHSNCSLCQQKIGASGMPLFWRVTIEHFGLDLRAVERLQGLTMMLGGNAQLAMLLGPDEDLAKWVSKPVVLTVCWTCAGRSMDLTSLLEAHEEGSK